MYNNQGYNNSYQNRYYSPQLSQSQSQPLDTQGQGQNNSQNQGQLQSQPQSQQTRPQPQQPQSQQQQQQQPSQPQTQPQAQPQTQDQQQQQQASQSYYPSNPSYSYSQNYPSYSNQMYPNGYIPDSTQPSSNSVSQSQSAQPQNQQSQQGQPQDPYYVQQQQQQQQQSMMDQMGPYASQMYQPYPAAAYQNPKMGYRGYPATASSQIPNYPIYPDYNNQIPPTNPMSKQYSGLNIPTMNVAINTTQNPTLRQPTGPGTPVPGNPQQPQPQPQQPQPQPQQSQALPTAPSSLQNQQHARPINPTTIVSNANSSGFQLSPTAGQIQPPGSRPKITTMWEDEKTLCYQVEANGVSVVRRADNNMINGTKLLNVAKMTRGRRDGILKAEKTRYVVKIGSMHLKGVWIPFERALIMAQREGIADSLYPLFVKDIQKIIQQGTPTVKMGQYALNPKPSNPQQQQQPQIMQHPPSTNDLASSVSSKQTNNSNSTSNTNSSVNVKYEKSEQFDNAASGGRNDSSSASGSAYVNRNSTDLKNQIYGQTGEATNNNNNGNTNNNSTPMMYPSYYNASQQSPPPQAHSQPQIQPPPQTQQPQQSPQNQAFYYGGYYTQQLPPPQQQQQQQSGVPLGPAPGGMINGDGGNPNIPVNHNNEM